MRYSKEQWAEIREATINAYKAAKTKISTLEKFKVLNETAIRSEERIYGSMSGTAEFDNSDMQKYKIGLASWLFTLGDNGYPCATYKIVVPGHHVIKVTEKFASQLTGAMTEACEEGGFNEIRPIGDNTPRGNDSFELWAEALYLLKKTA